MPAKSSDDAKPRKTGTSDHTRVSENIYIPKDPTRYKLRKLQILERKISQKPSNFSVKDYILLLDTIEEVLKRLDSAKSKNMEGQIHPRGQAPVSEAQPAGLDPGVLPEDLIAG